MALTDFNYCRFDSDFQYAKKLGKKMYIFQKLFANSLEILHHILSKFHNFMMILFYFI